MRNNYWHIDDFVLDCDSYPVLNQNHEPLTFKNEIDWKGNITEIAHFLIER